MRDKRNQGDTFWTTALGFVVIVGVATVFVVASLWPKIESGPEMGDAPEQAYLRTGAERQVLDELSRYVNDTGVHERVYLDLAHTWCRTMRTGGVAEGAVAQMSERAAEVPRLAGSVRLVAGVATLRMCPEQSGPLNAYYGEK